jgi:aldose 1-epimerase
MAQDANYSAQKLTRDGIEIVRLADIAGRTELSIAPSIGNNAFEMKVNGRPILLAPAGTLDEWKSKPMNCGIPFLAPWANRMDGDAYWANGKRFALNSEVINLRRDANGLPIHGMLLFADAWRVVRLNQDAGCAEVTSRLEFWKHPEWMAQFPFAHAIEMTHRLAGGVIEIRVAIENLSDERMPLSIGFHPWYQIPGCERDRWTVHLPVREHHELSSKMIPTGKTTPYDLPDPLPLAGRHFDDVFSGHGSGEEFWVEGDGRRITVRFGPKYPVAVFYAPQARDAVAFEPMTGIIDAFNLAHEGVYCGLQSIAAGATWTESFWIRTTGF